MILTTCSGFYFIQTRTTICFCYFEHGVISLGYQRICDGGELDSGDFNMEFDIYEYNVRCSTMEEKNGGEFDGLM